MLACCPEGTYVREGDKLLSFKPERASACPPLWPPVTEQQRTEQYGWVVTVGIILTVWIIVM